MKRFIKMLLIVLGVGGLGFLGYTFYRTNAPQATAETSKSYSTVTVSLGSLSKSVVSSGALTSNETSQVLAPLDMKVAEIVAEAGSQVTADSALVVLDTGILEEAIAQLKADIATQDSTLASLASQYKETQTLKSPVAGRVKAVYVSAGAFLQDALTDQPAIALLSLDGYMKAEFSVIADKVTTGSSLKVLVGETQYLANLKSIQDGLVTVTFSDAKVLPGDSVQLLLNGVSLGTGEAQINMPYLYTSLADGYVSAVTAKVNTAIIKNGSVLTLEQSALSQDYLDAQKTREELVKKLVTAQALLNDPVIYANTTGIVESILVSAGDEITQDTAIASLFTGDMLKMNISVDELDITSVQTGQTASLAMDALPDAAYAAEVTRINQIGTASSGITNYTVSLLIEKDEQLKLGMNGTATIAVEEKSDAILVPLLALQSDSQGSYVWKYDASLTQTSEIPGIKTYITTGLSNANYTAVEEGLAAGDQVLIIRSSASVSTGDPESEGFGGMQRPGNFDGMNPQDMPAFRNQPQGNPGGGNPSRGN